VKIPPSKKKREGTVTEISIWLGGTGTVSARATGTGSRALSKLFGRSY
jgi:hypothetical protein